MLESARGWAATILFNKELKAQFDAFYARPDAFSLGIAGRVGGARRGPLFLVRRRGEGGGDALELRGAEVHGRRQRDDGVPDGS